MVKGTVFNFELTVIESNVYMRKYQYSDLSPYYIIVKVGDSSPKSPLYLPSSQGIESVLPCRISLCLSNKSPSLGDMIDRGMCTTSMTQSQVEITFTQNMRRELAPARIQGELNQRLLNLRPKEWCQQFGKAIPGESKLVKMYVDTQLLLFTINVWGFPTQIGPLKVFSYILH